MPPTSRNPTCQTPLFNVDRTQNETSWSDFKVLIIQANEMKIKKRSSTRIPYVNFFRDYSKIT